MENFSVFADESGDFKNNTEGAITLAAVLISNSQLEKIVDKYNRLRDKVSKMGLNVASSGFEFHAVDLFNKRRYWRKLEGAQVREIAIDIRGIILGLTYAIVLIDKNQGGIQGTNEFKNDIKRFEKYEADLVNRMREALERIVPQKMKRKSMGKHSEIAGLLLGFINGLVDHLSYTDKQYKGDAKVLIDDQFVKQVGGLKILIQQLNSPWLREFQPAASSHWGGNIARLPKWHLGENIEKADSRLHYGIQAADFIAYTSRCQQENVNGLASEVAVTRRQGKDQTFWWPFMHYKGIYIGTPRRAIAK